MNTHRDGLGELRHQLSRRDFLRIAASAGAVGAGAVLLGGCGGDDGDGSAPSTPGIFIDPPPETTTIRLSKNAFDPITAPLYLAEEFLTAEGFTKVEYVGILPPTGGVRETAAGAIDIGLTRPSSATAAADAGEPIVVLGGVHNSAFQLFGNERVQTLRDLRGKRIWITKRDAFDEEYSLWAALVAFVGIDVEDEVEWVELNANEGTAEAVAGTIDAWVTWEPYTTLTRNGNTGRVVVDGTLDPPWSQHFGNVVTANRSFVEQHPAATKRALRALFKASDVCAKDPQRAARYVVDKGHTFFTYDEVLDAISGASYEAWHDFNPEDTMRFYALRLREAGILESTPDELIARATDWRYLDEIKRELGVA